MGVEGGVVVVREGVEFAGGGGEEGVAAAAAATEATDKAVDGWGEVAGDEAGVCDDKEGGGDDDNHCYQWRAEVHR